MFFLSFISWKNVPTGTAGLSSVKSKRHWTIVLKNFCRWDPCRSMWKIIENIPLPLNWCRTHLTNCIDKKVVGQWKGWKTIKLCITCLAILLLLLGTNVLVSNSQEYCVFLAIRLTVNRISGNSGAIKDGSWWMKVPRMVMHCPI